MKKLVKLVAVISIVSTTIGASAIGAEMKKGMHNNMAMSHENMEKMHNNMLAMKHVVISKTRK
jgi:hypothetical protein|tara:strand:- start:9495 stop:9683 length:189 start_codon:yes stop_codon:yes gene_type:complete